MALVLDIKVVPQSGRQECVLDKSGRLKCYLRKAPEAGKANEELIHIFAHALGIPKNTINIVLGATSRTKRIKIDAELSKEEVFDKLGVIIQQSLLS